MDVSSNPSNKNSDNKDTKNGWAGISSWWKRNTCLRNDDDDNDDDDDDEVDGLSSPPLVRRHSLSTIRPFCSSKQQQQQQQRRRPQQIKLHHLQQRQHQHTQLLWKLLEKDAWAELHDALRNCRRQGGGAGGNTNLSSSFASSSRRKTSSSASTTVSRSSSSWRQTNHQQQYHHQQSISNRFASHSASSFFAKADNANNKSNKMLRMSAPSTEMATAIASTLLVVLPNDCRYLPDAAAKLPFLSYAIYRGAPLVIVQAILDVANKNIANNDKNHKNKRTTTTTRLPNTSSMLVPTRPSSWIRTSLDSKGRTALHVACQCRRSPTIVECLLGTDDDGNDRNNDHNSHHDDFDADAMNRIMIRQMKLNDQERRRLVLTPDKAGNLPLHYAVETVCAQACIANVVSSGISASQQREYDNSMDVVSALIAVEPSTIQWNNPITGQSPLHVARKQDTSVRKLVYAMLLTVTKTLQHKPSRSHSRKQHSNQYHNNINNNYNSSGVGNDESSTTSFSDMYTLISSEVGDGDALWGDDSDNNNAYDENMAYTFSTISIQGFEDQAIGERPQRRNGVVMPKLRLL